MKTRTLYHRTFGTSVTAAVALLSLFSSGCGEKSRDTANALSGDPVFQRAMRAYDRCEFDAAYRDFTTVTSDHPEVADAWFWRGRCAASLAGLSACTTRESMRDTAAALARRSLALDPRSAAAEKLLADAYNPQYGGLAEVDAAAAGDSCWVHLRRAVRNDRLWGDAWCGIWQEALRRGDLGAEREALRELAVSDFFTPSILELNFWMLRSVPFRSILIVFGDLDTYPAVVLQAMRSVRLDVAIVNAPMLNLPWYAETVSRRYGIPLPMTRKEMEEYVPEGNAFARRCDVLLPSFVIDRSPQFGGDEDFIFLPAHEAIILWWLKENARGVLKRPVVFAATCDSSITVLADGKSVDAGAYRAVPLPGTRAHPSPAACLRAFHNADARRFTGGTVSPRDNSAMRRALPKDYAASFPFSAGLRALQGLVQSGQRHVARGLSEELERFVRKAGMPGERLVDIQRIMDGSEGNR